MVNKEVENHRDFSDWFLSLFAVQVIVLARENWQDLEYSVNNPGVMPIAAGLTHKDYMDGPVLWQAIPADTWLKLVVMKEGFFTGGLKGIRNEFLQRIAPGLPLSRKGAGAEEFRAIQEAGQDQSVVAVFLSGNRNLTSPLKGGVNSIMRQQDIMYPFVNLSDQEPIFPSGSSFTQNLGELASRVVFNRKTSHEFLYLMKPLTKPQLEAMAEGKVSKEGRAEILAKLEVLRAYGVLKTFIEVAKLGLAAANPLLNNADNLPLFALAQQRLKDEVKRVKWLVKHEYFDKDEVVRMLALEVTKVDEPKK